MSQQFPGLELECKAHLGDDRRAQLGHLLNFLVQLLLRWQLDLVVFRRLGQPLKFVLNPQVNNRLDAETWERTMSKGLLDVLSIGHSFEELPCLRMKF